MRWRPWLLSLCALGLLLTLASAVANMTVSGSLGLSGTPTPVAFVDRLVVQPGSASAESGIQTGDLLDWHRLSPAVRFRIYDGPRVGEPLALPIVRNGAERAVTVISNRASGFNWTDWLFFAGQIWIVLCCILIASRRAGDPEARLLIFYLLGVFVISQGFGNVITPWPLVDQLALIAKGLIFMPSFAFLALYAAGFGAPISVARRALIAIAIALAATATVQGVVERFELWNGSISPFTPALLVRADPFARLFEGAVNLAVMLSLLAALGASRGLERTRLLWALAAVLPFLLWVLVVVVTGELIPSAAFTVVSALGWFATPAILSYSLLNRRLFDIGFVLNRAAVFTSVSLILLGAFVLAEWSLTGWLGNAGHTANVLVGGGVALALGVSIRFVHGRVDRVIDNVFFRRRHEDEEAIRTFAREAPYITDPNILIRRATETLERHTDATSVDIVRRYDANDPAIVRLRANPQALDLHTVESELRGDIAFPITARGQLLAVVVLGARRSGERYAPDETAAISQLAASLGAVLDTFAAKNGRDGSLERLVASVDALRDGIDALRDEIGQRLQRT